jgi:L-aspartate oxidase
VQYNFDVLIIGSGSSGLMCALELPTHLQICIVSKKDIFASSSYYAQGGMSVAFASDIASHIDDTLNAADGLANKKSVEFLAKNSEQALEKLSSYGVPWSKYQGKYHLTKEGGHSHNRIAHIKDWTGKSIQETLVKNIKTRENICVFTEHLAVDLLTSNNQCGGAYVLDNFGKVQTFLAGNTVLATGGASKVYKYTTNPDTSTGDGVAMAYRASCSIVNMEFSQFHPTCLYHPHAKSFLISEALRGDGAKLLLPTGEEFMHKYDKRAELAPRDIVARAIDNEMKIGGYECVYLDISFKDSAEIKKHFPNIYHKCLEFNIDITRDKIPVVPAAHYSCGGVKTTLDAKTEVDNLYAIGEVAHTGVHGANRLASNSLLECVVFAISCAQSINNNNVSLSFVNWDASQVVASQEKVIVSHLWDEVRLTMWNYVGIVRSMSRLKYAKNRLEQIKIEVNDYYTNYLISADLIELRNLTTCGLIVIDSAIKRKESRGLHYNTNYPEKQDGARNTYITRQTP